MSELPANCSTASSHWFQVFNQWNGMIIGSLPTPGMRRSVMFPGDKLQSYPEDPSFAERTANLSTASYRIEPPSYTRTDLPTCPSQVFASNRISGTPNPLSFRKKAPPSTSTRSNLLSAGNGRTIDPTIPYTLEWPNADAISPQNLFLEDQVPVSSVARMPSSSRRSLRGEVDSSDEESNARGPETRRRAGFPYLPPVTKNMPGGADPYMTTPGGTRRPRTYEEVTALIMVAFKPKIDPKQFFRSKTKQNGFNGGTTSKLLLAVKVWMPFWMLTTA